RRGEAAAAQAHVDGHDGLGGAALVDALERGEDVGVVGLDAWGRAEAVEEPVEAREHLHGHQLRALPDAGEGDAGAGPVARRDAPDVRAVPAALDVARRRRAGAGLLVGAVRADGAALRARRGRVARLLDDLAGEERVRRLHARVDDGDDRPRA